jgi:hypothetical protein
VEPWPCPRDGGQILKALVTGLCALILLVVPAAAQAQSQTDLGAQLTHHLTTMKRSTQVVRFFDSHRWLLSDPRFQKVARRQLALHTTKLEQARARVVAAKAAIRKKAQVRRLAALREASPQEAICTVFGRYCGQALQVARCESGLTTTAQNGQYLGLFQMGSSERRLFGHGATAIEQVRAAHRYFVVSGRDWSPWSCKPWS